MTRALARVLLVVAMASLAAPLALGAGEPTPAPAKSGPATTQPAPATPAAPTPAPKPAKPDAIQQKLDAWKVEIDQIASGLAREGQTDRHLADLRENAERIRAEAGELVATESPRQASLEARLKQLGPAPQAKDDEPAPVEADAVKAERDDQQRQLAEAQGRIKQAQLVELRADEIIKTISDRRRDRFAREMMEQSRSLLDPTMWLEAMRSMPATFNGLGYLVGDWTRLLASRGLETAIAVGSVIVVVIALLISMRRRLSLFTERDPAAHEPPLLAKAAKAAGIVALNLAVPVVGLLGTIWALDGFDLAPDRVLLFLEGITAGVASAAAVYSVALALFAPSKPQWRLVAVDDGTAMRLVQLSVVLAVTHGVGVAAIRLLGVLAAPVAEVIVLSGLFALIDAVIAMAALRAAAHAFVGDETAPVPATAPRSLLWRWIVPLGWVVTIVAVGAVLTGYVALGSFLTVQLVRTGFLLGALFILLQLVDEAILAAFEIETPLGTVLNRSMGFARETVEQVGVVLSGVARLLLIAVAGLVALTPIGVSSQDVMTDAKLAFFGFKIGGFTFSLSTILSGLAFLVIGVAVTRGIQGWLDDRLLPRTRLDVGLKNSIRTASGYAGYVLSVMLAFSVVGLDLQNLAIVAGALSVGIGFGLQSIVNNFVSGLILLVERPVKVGDWIVVGDQQGNVRRISVRSTEIETFDRASLIVPNSSLISGNVKNWMHRDLTGRCLVDVGVAYDADPGEVREILLACAAAHEKVLKFPPPGAFFVKFGDSALEFRLVCTVGTVTDAYGVESDLRFAIVARLREKGIDIPYAQRDIHIRQLDDLRGALDAFLAGRPSQGPDRPA